MLKTQRMIKVGIVCPNNLLDKVINRLYDLQVIEIEEYTKDNGLDIGHPLKQGEDLSELIIQLRSIASYAGISLANKDYKKKKQNLSDIKTTINTLHSGLKEMIEKVEYYRKALAIFKNKSYKAAVETIKIESSRAKDSESIAFMGIIMKDIEKEIKAASETSFVVSKDVDGAKFILVLAPSAKKEELKVILNQNKMVSIDNNEIKKLLPQIKAKNIDAEIKSDDLPRLLKNEERELTNELKMVKDQYEDILLNSSETLEEEVRKSEVPIKFAATKNTHIINGWVPKERFEKVKASLENETNNKVFIQAIPLKEHETGPILLKNPKPANSFQFLLNLFSLPTYWEIDPTIIMFLTFPFFFGFMLGDIGYGLVTLIIFGLMRLKFNKGTMKYLLNILMASSVGTIIFGFLFGEIFGEEVIPFINYEMPHILSRSHQILDLLSITIILGVIHILIGLIIGFINISKHHGLKHAFFEKAGWMLLLPLILWIVTYLKIVSGSTSAAVTSILPPFIIIAGLTIAAIVIIIIGEGVKGAIEIPGIFSNVLSYARLMAVGLASVELAIIINELSAEMFHKGGLMIVLAIIILLIGHVINLLLGLLGPALHSLRLHYVEFFGKFYNGGGKRFTPFGEKED